MIRRPLALSLLFCALAACSDDTPPSHDPVDVAPDADPMCFAGEVYNETLGRCEAVFEVPDETPDTDAPVDTPDMDPSDVTPDIDVPDPACDKDFDGDLAPECGGSDCDDNDPRRSSQRQEICDDIDNNCDGRVNGGLVCEFFAHSADKLYKIDPFKKTAREMTNVVMPNRPTLQDLDTNPADGVLYGISREQLYRYEEGLGWQEVNQSGLGNAVRDVDVNGLAITSDGVGYATAEDKLFRIDLTTGIATRVGQMQADVYSSGDCVLNKADTLYMTSKKTDEDDSLVLISHGEQGATGNILGSTGFRNIFALTAAWGNLYGLNNRGELILLNEQTGAGTLLHTFQGLSFFGAASTPAR